MPDTQTQPRHIALILDGNRRWAKKRGLKSVEGHQRGAEVLKKIALDMFDRGIPYVSAYIFSTENWQRTKSEVNYLMGLVIKATEKYLDEFVAKDIQIKIIGSKDNLPKNVLESTEKVEAKTSANKRGTLALCFNYGGKDEIVNAVRSIVQDKVEQSLIDEQLVDNYLSSGELPPVDLLIRTSGEQRLSGFLLWKTAYAELFFTKTLWPDFDSKDVEEALEFYYGRDRRYGI